MKDLDKMEMLEDDVMSNFDHNIDRNIEKKLRNNPNKYYSNYPGWNFCGYVWFNGKQFINQVWVYNSPVKEIKADTLDEIMNETSSEFGYD